MYRTKIGQGTLASTNQLLLRGFSCEFLGLFNQMVLVGGLRPPKVLKNMI
jgi:hypothetical protein